MEAVQEKREPVGKRRWWSLEEEEELSHAWFFTFLLK